MARCLIGCGSNLGQRRDQLDRAVELLRFMPGVKMEAVSRYRETRPIGGPGGQGSYLNGACLIETDLEPHDVLGMLAAVENTLHRDRSERWGERTIDLDLLLYDDLVIESRSLTVPHPRMATRRFVLEPCVEIAADLPFPPTRCTLRELLENISVPHPLVVVVGAPGSGAPEVAATLADATMSRLIHAPAALPTPLSSGAVWREAAAAWARPLSAAAWHDDSQAAIADFWFETLAEAARDLPGAEAAGVAADHAGLAAATVTPQVAILLVADAATLEERLAFHRRGAAHTDLFADFRSGGTACASPAETVAAALRLQERLVRRLRCPGERSARSPKAVVAIDAADLGQAAGEAIAAVEAML